MILVNKQKTIFKFAQLTLGLGLLFLGLQFMKESMNQLLNNFNFTPYLSYPLIAFVLFGFIITAIVQTSEATVVLVLTAIYTKVLPIETGVAFVLGAELGTTIKLVLGSIGGIASNKRVAFGNIIFNFITSIFGFIFLVPIINIINNKFGIHDPIFILVAFQTFINITGVIMIFFYKWLC
jgi:phosphate:Na+ symporter